MTTMTTPQVFIEISSDDDVFDTSASNIAAAGKSKSQPSSSSSQVEKKSDERQIKAYKLVAEKNKWYNADGSLLPVSAENLCKFIILKASTNALQSIRWYVYGIAKYQEETGISDGGDIKKHPDVKGLIQKIAQEHKAKQQALGIDPKNIKKEKQKANIQARLSFSQVNASSSSTTPFLDNHQQSQQQPSSSTTSSKKKQRSKKSLKNFNSIASLSKMTELNPQIVIDNKIEWQQSNDQINKRLDLSKEEFPSRALLMHLGCWTEADEEEFLKYERENAKHPLLLAQCHGIWLRRISDCLEDEIFLNEISRQVNVDQNTPKRPPLMNSSIQRSENGIPMLLSNHEKSNDSKKRRRGNSKANNSEKTSFKKQKQKLQPRANPQSQLQHPPNGTNELNKAGLLSSNQTSLEFLHSNYNNICAGHPKGCLNIGDNQHLPVTDEIIQYWKSNSASNP
ncbi:10367_t:CDS:2 [Ambispora gerdemannii]|uniref:10367_t:CDS:1 n=1 Tax=Ambispora gerdemannii TaxID=144530 RepID=A0A9N9FJY1_9GLOM|nr:10367_t:CDS:2 [Ambispora gerdemannii]